MQILLGWQRSRKPCEQPSRGSRRLERRLVVRQLVLSGALVSLSGCVMEVSDERAGNPYALTAYHPMPEEALTTDLAAVAKTMGWTLEQATAHYEAAEAVGRVAEEISLERPDMFVGSMVSTTPPAEDRPFS